jgi:leader peptidase (prepilin peptidase) / N-methyltransferase
MNDPALVFVMQVLIGLALGGIIGSFITMLSYRLPRHKSLVAPRSSCPQCRKVIPWSDMIPVYSYIARQGKCSSCGKEYGKRYLIIEAVSVVATTAILLIYGFSAKGFMLIIIFALLYGLYSTLKEQGKMEKSK